MPNISGSPFQPLPLLLLFLVPNLPTIHFTIFCTSLSYFTLFLPSHVSTDYTLTLSLKHTGQLDVSAIIQIAKLSLDVYEVVVRIAFSSISHFPIVKANLYGFWHT